MFQLPQETWNNMAKSVPLKTKWAETMFLKDDEEVTEALEGQARQLEKAGHDNKVILAYQTVTPILLEREAITKYISKTGKVELRGALPDLESPGEAVALMKQEYNLNESQMKDLMDMLKRLTREA